MVCIITKRFTSIDDAINVYRQTLDLKSRRIILSASIYEKAASDFDIYEISLSNENDEFFNKSITELVINAYKTQSLSNY